MMMMISDIQNAIFVIRNVMMNKSSRQCPNCNSYSIVSDNRSGGNVIMDYLHCDDCKAKWINQYEFSGQFMILMPESTV
jgi:predicted Zn-ribbon and HTH transcriptional regulator